MAFFRSLILGGKDLEVSKTLSLTCESADDDLPGVWFGLVAIVAASTRS